MSSSLNRRKIVTFNPSYPSRIGARKNSELSERNNEENTELIEENDWFPEPNQLIDVNQHLNEANQDVSQENQRFNDGEKKLIEPCYEIAEGNDDFSDNKNEQFRNDLNPSVAMENHHPRNTHHQNNYTQLNIDDENIKFHNGQKTQRRHKYNQMNEKRFEDHILLNGNKKLNIATIKDTDKYTDEKEKLNDIEERRNDVRENHDYANEKLNNAIEKHDDMIEHPTQTNNPNDMNPEVRLTANIDERIPLRFLNASVKWKLVFAAKSMVTATERGRRDLERGHTIGGIPRRFLSRESLDIVDRRDGEEELQAVLERIPERFQNIERLQELEMDVDTMVY